MQLSAPTFSLVTEEFSIRHLPDEFVVFVEDQHAVPRGARDNRAAAGPGPTLQPQATSQKPLGKHDQRQIACVPTAPGSRRLPVNHKQSLRKQSENTGNLHRIACRSASPGGESRALPHRTRGCCLCHCAEIGAELVNDLPTGVVCRRGEREREREHSYTVRG